MLKTLIKKVKKSKGGFTLIELIVVVCILAILAAILIPAIGGQIGKARKSAYQSDAQSIYTACVNASDDLNGVGCASLAGVAPGSTMLADSAMATVYDTTSSTWKDGITSVLVTSDANGSITKVSIVAKDAVTYNYPQ